MPRPKQLCSMRPLYCRLSSPLPIRRALHSAPPTRNGPASQTGRRPDRSPRAVPPCICATKPRAPSATNHELPSRCDACRRSKFKPPCRHRAATHLKLHPSGTHRQQTSPMRPTALRTLLRRRLLTPIQHPKKTNSFHRRRSRWLKTPTTPKCTSSPMATRSKSSLPCI